MQPFEDKRKQNRFKQDEEATDKAVINPELPDWQRNFIHYMWYARLPTAVWNSYVNLPAKLANDLINGKPVEMDITKVNAAIGVGYVANELISRGVLPCSDPRAILAVLQLGVEVYRTRYALQQLETKMQQNQQ